VLWGSLLFTLIAQALPASFEFKLLKSFGYSDRSGMGPRGIIRGADGRWYGTTRGGGRADEWGNGYGAGTVFRLNPDGSGYTNLHVFSRAAGEGFGPYARLIEGSDGALYGTTHSGGATNESSEGGGTLFRIQKDGGGYTVLHRFGLSHTNGSKPYAPLLEGSDGYLYGSTRHGGVRGGDPEGLGTLFKIRKDGSDFTLLHQFKSTEGDGTWPDVEMIEGSDGALYGTTSHGVAGSEAGCVAFRMQKDGSGYAVLRRFVFPSGVHPSALMEGSDGVLYGTATYGGPVSRTNNVSEPLRGMGVVFRLERSGDGFAVIHGFSDVNGQGRRPASSLMEGSDGMLYGITTEGGDNGWRGTVFQVSKNGDRFRVLAELPEFVGDGFIGHHGPLVEGADGALYSAYGSAVFRVTRDGAVRTELHRFSYSGGDGRFPAPLIEGSDGLLYGATASHSDKGGGTIFAMKNDGTDFRVLHVIDGPGFDADEGYFDSNTFALLEGKDGLFYGTMKNTDARGEAFIFQLNKDGTGFRKLRTYDYTGEGDETLELMQASDGVLYGTVLGNIFKVNPDGSGYTVLYETAIGIGPIGALTEASDGALYGIGFATSYRGDAVVFRLNRDDTKYAVVHRFEESAGGLPPQLARTPLVETRDGLLMGTTTFGGLSHLGILFQMNKDGSDYKVLHPSGGSLGLVGSDGAIYGTTAYGGVEGQGSVFRVGKDGTGYTELFSFQSSIGYFPSRLIQGRDGVLYGTTLRGGHLNLGTVFALKPKAELLPPLIRDGGVTVRFASMPNSTHRLQRIEALGGSWQTLSSMTIPGTGVAEFLDRTAPRAKAFYRAIAP